MRDSVLFCARIMGGGGGVAILRIMGAFLILNLYMRYLQMNHDSHNAFIQAGSD